LLDASYKADVTFSSRDYGVVTPKAE